MGTLEQQETGEESQIRRAFFMLIQGCPLIPDTISVKYGDTGNNSIGLFSQKGEKSITKQFISGAYEAQLPFLLRYVTIPQTDDDRINAEEFLADIADWMRRLESFPALSEERKVLKIETGNVYSDKKQEDGTVNYEVTVNLKYRKGSK